MAESNPPPEQMIQTGHELRDLSPKHIAIFAASLTVTIVIVFLVSSALMRYYYNRQQAAQPPRSPLSFKQPPMPEPRLMVTPGEELAQLRNREEARLNSYAWIDEQRGLARIPIERAMEMLAQKGLPARKEKTEKSNKEESAAKGKESGNETQRKSKNDTGQ